MTRVSRARFPWIVAGVLALVGGSARAQEHPVSFDMRVTNAPASVPPGGALTLLVTARIPVGWHVYSITQPPGGPIATKLRVAPTQKFRISGTIRTPLPESSLDPNFGIETEWYEDSTSYRVPVVVVPNVPAGRHEVRALVAYQTCNARYCLPPTEDTLRASITVEGAAIASVIPPAPEESAAPTGDGRLAAATAPANAATTATATAASAIAGAGSSAPAAGAARGSVSAPVAVPTERGASSFGLFLWLAATMGALSLLTPCVFPMVPITVSFFSQREQVSRAASVGHAFLYAGGIVGAFSGLGLGAALLVGVAGLNRFAANPLLNLAIAALFIGFALSLFELVPVALPSRLVNWLDRQARGNSVGRVGATLLMGATFAVTTLTCTAPFVGTLLVSATQGDWRWPAAGLVVFSSVMALPFLILALVPKALSRLPRSGVWMQSMKASLGFVELAAATKFLSNADLVQGWGIFTRQAVIGIWLVLGVLLVLYLLGARARTSAPFSGARYPVPAVAALAATVWLSSGLRGGRLGELESFLPPAGASGDGVASGAELSWLMNDYAGALEQARREKKLVLVDFTGYTCTNCRWMEANMFPRPGVRRELDRFVRARLFTDGVGELYARQQKLELTQFRTVALPLYAVVDSTGATRATFLGMTRDTGEFERFLAGALAQP